MILFFKQFFLLFTLFLFVQAQQDQSFTIKPVNTNAVLGSTVVLKCAVTAKHGDVQWTHEGTALGYDRQVPGKPRYKVIWTDNEDQEYHLQIVNVTLDDEGVYACQVAPIGDWDTKLEEKVTLTVLVAPLARPEIMLNFAMKNNKDVIQIKQSEISGTRFRCKIGKSKPASQVKWFLNSTLLTNATATVTETKEIKNYLFTETTSVLEFKPNTQFNNSLIKCQAYHLAYNLSVELENLSSALRLVIVYPPSTPQIIGYDSATGVIAGTILTLICSSQYIYPPAQLTWYKNSTLLSTNYDTIESRTEADLKVKIEPADNQAIFRCNAINAAIEQPLTSFVAIKVLYGPTNVILNGQFEAKVNENISASCASDASNPKSRLIFIFAGMEYAPDTIISTNSPNAGTMLNATISIKVDASHNGKEIKCLVENKDAGIQKIISKTVNVIYPAESLDLTYNEENKTVAEGKKVSFICKIKGGNPPSEIEWYIGGGSNNKLPRAKQIAKLTETFLSTITSTLEIVLHSSHHNQPVECVATNKVTSLKKSVKILVSYLPMNVTVRQIEPVGIIKAGSRVVMACVASNSNPEAQISWYKNSYIMSFESNGVEKNISSKLGNDFETVSYMSFIATSSDHERAVQCDATVNQIQRAKIAPITMNVAFAPEILIQPQSLIDKQENTLFTLNLTARSNPAPKYSCFGPNNKTYPVENSTLRFNTTRQDNSEFRCLISNTESNTEIKFRLNVTYAPSVTAVSNSYIATKGDTLNIACNVNANPFILQYVDWKLNGKTIPATDTRFVSKIDSTNLAVLSISSIRETEDGNFTCTINNRIGLPAIASTRVLVKRAPIILENSTLKAAEDSNFGRSARFICITQAYPDVSFIWRFPNSSNITNSTKYTISNSKIDNSQIQMSTLLISGVVSSDYASYICEAKNTEGFQSQTAKLSGKHQPYPPTKFRVKNITKNSIFLEWDKQFDGGNQQRFRIRYRKDILDPTYKYVETVQDQTSILLDNLEMATRYIINIQSFNDFGSEGYLQDPLRVQTDFGFNDVSQLPIYTGNDLPLTIILVVCGVGTLLLLFNVILIIYFIRKRKRKGETDSTTGTNETDANTIEMFTPPPPYPDDLNYHLEFSPSLYEDENKPFVPQTIKYIKKIPNSDNEYSVEYATPMQSWNDGANNELLTEDMFVSTFRESKNLDGYARSRAAYPYESICNQHTNLRLGDIERLTIKPSSNSHNIANCLFSSVNSSNNNYNHQQGKIYQSLDEFKGHLV